MGMDIKAGWNKKGGYGSVYYGGTGRKGRGMYIKVVQEGRVGVRKGRGTNTIYNNYYRKEEGPEGVSRGCEDWTRGT